MFSMNAVTMEAPFQTGAYTIDRDTQPLAVVSGRYTLITPEALVEEAARHGFREHSRRFSRSGTRSWQRFHGGGQGGDYSALITVANSFDGRASLRASVGALRLVCANGMVSEVKLMDAVRRHSGRVDLSDMFAALVEAARGAAYDMSERLEALRGVEHSRVTFRGSPLLDVVRNVVSERGMARLADTVGHVYVGQDRQVLSGWAVLQGLTDYAHRVPPNKQAQIEAAAGSIIAEYQLN